ncbi:MAG: TetR/AcrR family transcriptional regulator [Eubacteriales bacterium]|nr:TetR/AcrR family transcriptional regulator [Eubacteriales bacterium]
MDKFLALSKEKQRSVIDAALQCFGKHGYKKASMRDIADLSGVSKPMLFHYFGTKLALYAFLTDYVKNTVMKGYQLHQLDGVEDLFDRILAASSMKMSLLRSHRFLPPFMMSMLHETEEEAVAVVKATMPDPQKYNYDLVVRPEDEKKFKEGVDIKAVMRMIYLMGEGYGLEMMEGSWDYDKIDAEFQQSLAILKRNLYKED